MADEEITIWPAPARRWIATALLAGLGLMLLWGGLSGAETGAARGVMGGLGLLLLWGAWALWRSTGRGLVLARDGIRDTSGRSVVRFEEIAGLERGVFALKPSNGVLIKTTERGPIAWVPGLWWRLGARVGIGGMTPKAETKALGDLLEARLAAQNGND